MHCSAWCLMEADGYIYGPTALSQIRELLLPAEWEALYAEGGAIRIPTLLQGNEPRFLSHRAHGLITVLCLLSWFLP